MKYGTTNTFSGNQKKKHGHTVKPAMLRYFQSLCWLKNKEKSIEKEPTTQDCIDLINNTKHWNGGLGLIVPHRVAEELRKMGITEGYTEQVDMPTSNHL